MQKKKEKKLKSTDEEGGASIAIPRQTDHHSVIEEKVDEQEIFEDVGGIQFEVCSTLRWSAIVHCSGPVCAGLSTIQRRCSFFRAFCLSVSCQYRSFSV